MIKTSSIVAGPELLFWSCRARGRQATRVTNGSRCCGSVSFAPGFHALLGRRIARACPYALDLLQVGDEDPRSIALVERRALLREHLKHARAATRSSTATT